MLIFTQAVYYSENRTEMTLLITQTMIGIVNTQSESLVGSKTAREHKTTREEQTSTAF